MAEFSIQRMEEVGGSVAFCKLIRNGRCPFDEFCADIKSSYRDELTTAYRLMDALSKGEKLPDRKFHIWSIKGVSTRTFELKTKNLRIYIAAMSSGRIVVLGGYKNSQSKDAVKFESIMKEYESFLKTGTK